jgi:hypothetical protein
MDPGFRKLSNEKEAARRRMRYHGNPEYRAKVIARTSAASKARCETRSGFITGSVSKARSRAKDGGLPFDITEDYMVGLADESAARDDRCPVFPWFTMLFRRGGGEAGASMDRIVPELGYVKGNVRWISLRANLLRRDADATELMCLSRDSIRLENHNPASNEATKEAA